MPQKSKQKSGSKPQLEAYAFPPSPQSRLFEHYDQFRDDEPALGPVLGYPSPSERKQQLLDKELELVKQEKAKLALELEVLRLRQVLGPATPPTTSAAPCATGKSDTKKKIIDCHLLLLRLLDLPHKNSQLKVAKRGITRFLVLVIPLLVTTPHIICAEFASQTSTLCYTVPSGKCQFPTSNDWTVRLLA